MPKIKIEQTDQELNAKTRELENKLAFYANEVNTLQEQITLYSTAVQNYRTLLDAENDKFSIGESSLFLINSREQKYLDAQVKLLKLWAAYQKALLGVDWALGGLR